ncbi:MAG TPA: proteasome ATPase, partial [Actinomycetota bacterium]|nr:proteasome ATPase [Actinomycetota bacterium]
MTRESEFERRIGEYEREVGELQMQVKMLEEEAGGLRVKLADVPLKIRKLEEELELGRSELLKSHDQGERMAAILREAREQIVALRDEIDKLTAPPNGYGVFLGTNDDETVNVFTGGRKVRVNVSPELDASTFVRGQELMLNEALNVIAACDYEVVGEVVHLKELIEENRALVFTHADEERVVQLSSQLAAQTLQAGDLL